MIVNVFGMLISYATCYFFFFSSRRRHTRLQGDWSSDVCSSDLGLGVHIDRVSRGCFADLLPPALGLSAYGWRRSGRKEQGGRDDLGMKAHGSTDRKSVV